MSCRCASLVPCPGAGLLLAAPKMASLPLVLAKPRSLCPAAGEWRTKKELVAALEASIPWEERGGGAGDEIFIQTLRNNWTRYVPLGNLFSGLFVEIKEKSLPEQAA